MPTRHDLKILLALPFLTAIAWCVPPKRWASLARLKRRAPFRGTRPAAQIQQRGAYPKWNDWGGLLPYLREFHPSGWHPEIHIENAERLLNARAKGHGVLLWVADFRYSSLVVKKTLSAEGFAVHHLSRPGHGPSSSRFGMRHLNWIMQAIEERYVAERIVLASGSEVPVLRRMHDVLAAGGICSITANAEGTKVQHVPFSGRRYPLATGAPSLALSSDAELIPVFCVPAGDRYGFRVVIDEQIDLRRDVPRKAAIESAMTEYVNRHRPFVEDHPNVWGGFRIPQGD